MPKLNMESLLPFIEEAFDRGLDFQIPITGTSMNPLLYQNRDFVKIVKPILPLKLGDIPLYRRNDGAFVLHRVVGIRENGEYIMCGDNQFLLEYGITDKNIIGIAKALIIDGREIDVETDAEYLRHKEKYLKNVKSRYPARRLRYKLHFVKQRILKRGMRNAECGNKVACGKWQAANSGARKCAENISANNEKTQDILNIGVILINAIRSYIRNEDFEFPENTDFRMLYELAQNHRVTPMVAPVVIKSKIANAKVKGAFSKELFKNSARTSAQEKEMKDISSAFSKEKISHCFLKGSKVSAYYDNPDCRFMLDMDLYVAPEGFKQAENLLESMGYSVSSNEDDKDKAYTKPPFFILELHKELKYDYDKGYEYYKGAFSRMYYSDGSAMSMTDEDFYVYILSHTAHHFETAGTGIKSIVDHYYLKEKLKPECNRDILKKSLEDIGLSLFENKLDRLCDFWFSDAQADSLTEEMSDYIILSGVFGNEANQYISGILRGDYGDDAKSYFLCRIFPPLKALRIRYPVLKKAPVLLPLFWGIRIFASLINPKKLTNETKVVLSADASEKEKQKQFFDNLGL